MFDVFDTACQPGDLCVKPLKITIVLALLAVPSAALAANTSQPQAINCSQLKTKPTRITLSCGDAGTWLGKLKWSSWTNTQAVANGNFTANNCTPDCAAGNTHSVAVKVTLSKVKMPCPSQVSPAFKQADDHLQGHAAQGRAAEAQLPLPGRTARRVLISASGPERARGPLAYPPAVPLRRRRQAPPTMPLVQEETELPDVEAHITGTVWKIEVEVGDEVQEGDTVVILESMKMEMPVEAEDPGVVKEIRCEEGQSVSEGDTLVVLE